MSNNENEGLGGLIGGFIAIIFYGIISILLLYGIVELIEKFVKGIKSGKIWKGWIVIMLAALGIAMIAVQGGFNGRGYWKRSAIETLRQDGIPYDQAIKIIDQPGWLDHYIKVQNE